jgi:hypothetical protein
MIKAKTTKILLITRTLHFPPVARLWLVAKLQDRYK